MSMAYSSYRGWRERESVGGIRDEVDFGEEVLGGDGFDDVFVHAGLEAAFAIAVHGVGGKGDDRGVDLEGGLEWADGGGGFVAVHFGHLDVHSDDDRRVDSLFCYRRAPVASWKCYPSKFDMAGNKIERCN